MFTLVVIIYIQYSGMEIRAFPLRDSWVPQNKLYAIKTYKAQHSGCFSFCSKLKLDLIKVFQWRSIISKQAEKSGNFSRVINRTCKKFYWTADSNEGDWKPAVKEWSLFWIPSRTGSSDCLSPYSDGIAVDCWRSRRRN